MSARSKSSDPADPRRPFDAKVWKKAEAIVANYQIVLAVEDAEWYGRGLELPTVMSDGKTAAACVKNTREALAVTVATLLEDGEAIPPAAKQNVRDQQVNIRLSAAEKAALEAAAAGRGFRGLSDFVRDAALRGAATA